MPISVGVRPYAWEHPCSQSYLVDREPAQVPPPPVQQDAPGWVRAMGAVSAGLQVVEVSVQGTGEDTVVLQALRVRVVGRAAPPAWNEYLMGVGCGGDIETESYGIDLDAARPQAVPKGGEREFRYSVSESDPEVLVVTADAKAGDVSWYLELEWTSGDRHGTVRVDDRGRPFRTSGVAGTTYAYPLGGSAWETYSPEG
ncbi:hypothetical protein [Streptomyces sp. GC420]|uniref:hypothetical protein n=1 Tax=Streptomyces sp. GC420 TaxID=2697568 RepID=UPI0014151F65|nr:hypothetical protein [Streptomyces sp. GC420]NBM20368.1 hypothetical protein [Streptomyces sp. GC420]